MWPEKVRQDRPPGSCGGHSCEQRTALRSYFSPRSHLTSHDRHYWMKRQQRSLDLASSFSFSSCKIEYGDLGQELVTRAMDRMKVLGMGRLSFQFFAQLQNVVIDSSCTRVVLVSPHFIE